MSAAVPEFEHPELMLTSRKHKLEQLTDSDFESPARKRARGGSPVPSPNVLSQQNSPDLSPSAVSARVPEVQAMPDLPAPAVSTVEQLATDASMEAVKKLRERIAVFRALHEDTRNTRLTREFQLRQLQSKIQDARYQLSIFRTDLHERTLALRKETEARRAAELELKELLSGKSTAA